MQIGGLGYVPMVNDAGEAIDGTITITTSIPLSLIDPANPVAFFLLLRHIGGTADYLEEQLMGQIGFPDVF